MSTVRISKKNAQAVAAHLEQVRALGPDLAGALRQLKDGLAPRRVKQIEKDRRDGLVSKRERKNDETSEIRRQVMERAGGRCECRAGRIADDGTTSCAFDGGPGGRLELDHFFGRGKVKQSVSNTWALSPTCHRHKTNNHPDSDYWLGLFIKHCELHGYGAEARRAQDRLDGNRIIRSAAGISARSSR